MRICPKCRKLVRNKYQYCPKCGLSFQKTDCAHCGKELPYGAEYCPYCGKMQIAVTHAQKKPISAKTVSGTANNHPKTAPAFPNQSKPVNKNKDDVLPMEGLLCNGTLIIPDGTKEIKRSEYKKRENIKRVILPEGLETIADGAFYGCVNLEKINIPASVKKMGQQAFCECSKLTSAGPYNSRCAIEFGATDRILENMFFNCKFLKKVHLPKGITEIGKDAFFNCKSIEELVIPNTVTEIGADAFEFCSSLKNLVLPENVEKIGVGAFRGCNQLCDQDGFVIVRSVLYSCLNVDGVIKIPQGVTTIDSDAFTLGTSISNETTTEIIIPNSVVRITHHRAFLACKNLEAVTISEDASDEVKEIAQIIADRAEEKRKKRERPKPVIIREPGQLWVFRSANSAVMSSSIYQAILAKLQGMRDRVLGNHGETDTRWSESANMISLFDKYSHWVGHDDTVSESINLIFSREETTCDHVEWSADSDWPCQGQYLLFDKSWSRAPNQWDYTYVTHKAWLLKEPYGIPGVWRFEYETRDAR